LFLIEIDNAIVAVHL